MPHPRSSSRHPRRRDARSRRAAASAVLSVSLALLFGAPAPSGAAEARRIVTLADGVPTLTEAAAVRALGTKRPELCATPVDKRAAPSLTAALKDARGIVRKGKGSGAERTFLKSRDARSVDRSLAAAAGALTAGRPVAALAALRRAHGLKPKDQRPLVGLSTVMSQLGRPRAGLAFAEAARRAEAPKHAPFGTPPRALVANARGYALLGLGRWSAAETALKPAVTSAPLLTEARHNLAHAQLCQGGDAGARAAAAGRTAAPAARRAGPAKNVVRNPAEDGGPVIEQPVAADWLDLSRGVEPTLPTWPVPQSEAEASALWDGLRARWKGASDRVGATSAEIQAMAPAVGAEIAPLSPGTKARLSAIRTAMIRPELDPSLRDVWTRFGATGETLRDIATRYGSGQGGHTCGAYGEWKAAYQAYETTGREWARGQYRYMTAVAANAGSPRYHASLQAQARQSLAVVLASLQQQASYLAEHGWRCHAASTPAADAGQDRLDTPDAGACPAGLKGVSFRLKLPVVQVAVSCESVSLEVDSGTWIGAFANVSHNVRKGETTVFAGPRAKLTTPGPFGSNAGVKDGLYVTVGNDGSIRDVGARVSTSVSLASGPASVAFTTTTMDFSFVGVSPIATVFGP